MSRIGVALFAALMGITLFSGEARAQSAPLGYSVESANVDYSDIDLNSQAGADILLARIQRSAERVCGLQESRRRGADLRQRAAARTCIHQAVERAVTRIDSASVQSAYADGGYRERSRALTTASVVYEGDNFRVRVPYAGYDLTSDRGRLSASRTIERAARRACNAGLIVSRAERACINDALASGETQLAAAAQVQLASTATPAAAAASVSAEIQPASNGIDVRSTSTLQAMQAGFGVCEPRLLAANFAGASTALGRSARSEVEYAVDSASVCRLSTVTVAVNGTGDLSRRRAEVLRATLIRRGVPAEVIRTELGASVSSPQVSMTFNGVASAETDDPTSSAPAV